MPYKNSDAKRAANRRHYQANKARYQEAARTAKRKLRAKTYALVNELKTTNPCTDCGLFFDPICMDFDHCQGVKVANVSRLINEAYSLQVVLAEIEKCELVCANCHRIRTRDRG